MKPLVTTILLIAALLGFPAAAQPPPEPTVVTSPLAQAIDAYLSRVGDLGYGFSVDVIEGDRVTLQKGYGGQTASTVYNVASVAKQFTATAILKLASQGRLSLDQRITDFFPNAPTAMRQVTVDHLLSHTSGIRDDYSLYEKPGMDRDAFVARVLARPLASAPGKEWDYSNDGYALLALIVERASGRPFKQYLREALFQPAGLRNAAFLGDRNGPRARPSGGAIPPKPEIDIWNGGLGGNDLVISTADLARWEQAMRTDRILDSASRARLTQAVIEVFPPALSYARGWWVRRFELNGQEARNIFHSGREDDGSNAWFSRYPDQHLTIIFASAQSLDNYSLREAFFAAGKGLGPLEKMAFGGAIELPPPVADLGAQPSPGIYRLDPRNSFEVLTAAPFLVITPHGQHAFDLLRPRKVTDAVSAISAKATGRTEAILNALAAGDAAPFRKAAGGKRDDGTTLEPPHFTRVEVLGSAPLTMPTKGDPSMVTYVRFDDRTDVVTRFVWSGEDLETVFANSSPVLPPFRAVSDGQYANFQPFIQSEAFIRFEAGKLIVGDAAAAISPPA